MEEIKMTQNIGNKQILSIADAQSKILSNLYFIGDITAINEVLNDFLGICADMDKIPKKYNCGNVEYLTFSLGNSKIGNDTLCISLTSGLFCPMRLTGNCNNCNICYAVNQNKMYFRNTVPKNTINQILINKVLNGKLTLHKLLMNTVQEVYCQLTSTELKNLKFLRFNVEGDILNQDILMIAEKVAQVLIDVFELKSAYSYTHNKELDLSKADHIKFNCSDFKNKSSITNSCYTIFEVTKELRKQIINAEVILCNGDCNSCPYCKDYKETRPILFLAHGGQYKGIEAIKETDKELWDYITINKEIDYLNYIYGEISP